MGKFLIFFMLAFEVCLAQEKKQGNVDAMVNFVLSKNMNSEALMDSPKGMAYFFTVTLLFDAHGKVDTGFYSKNLDKKVTSVMGLNANLIKKIKEQNMTYGAYASKAVVVPIFFFRRTDTGIDYGTGFIKAIQNLLPKNEPLLWGKPWVILDPVINPFVEYQ